MAEKPTTRGDVNTFIQGIITEASPLNFPPNASLDEENFEANIDGTRDRRLGMDFEISYSLIPTGESAGTLKAEHVNTYKWFTVGGDVQKEFLVAQVNKKLYFFDVKAVITSTDGLVGTVDLSIFPANTRYSFTSLEGKLVVVSGQIDIAVITFNLETSTFDLKYQRIKTRDLWGVQSATGNYETDATYRNAAIDNAQYYNLQNQSWGIPRKNKAGTLVNPLAAYRTDLGVYPSNSELVWTGLQYQPVSGSGDPFERIYTNLYTEVIGADIKAPRGYYIIDALNRGTSRMAEYAENAIKYPQLALSTIDLPVDQSPTGASCVTEFAGRVWYGGFEGQVVDGDDRSPILTNYVFFSQLVKSPSDITKCYQEGDPSSRDNSDLVDTDGGFLRVSGANQIIALRNLDTHLVIFATNGIWTVTGGSEYGFSATNYKVSKISSYGGLTESSIIVEGGQAYYWSEDGIYVVTRSELGDLVVRSITEGTIQSLYGQIPITSKYTTIATYDMYNKTIRWLYKSGNIFTPASETKELILDTRIGSFFKNRIVNSPTADIELIGGFNSYSSVTGSLPEPIFVGLEPVYVDDEYVEAFPSSRISGVTQIKYLTLVRGEDESVSLTFSQYGDESFRDWKTYDGVGVDAKAYILTGSYTAGDSAVPKQVPYIIMHFRRTEFGVDELEVPKRQSSCLMRSQWNWANTINSNKWSPLMQMYRYRRPRFVVGPDDSYDNGFETVISRTKVRGRGRAFSLYFETEPDKDCRVIGWNLTVNANPVT